MSAPVPLMRCAGGCGRGVPDAQIAGWTFLEISGRYRCAECDKVLAWASSERGPATTDQVDEVLPPTSRGALKELKAPPELREHVKP